MINVIVAYDHLDLVLGQYFNNAYLNIHHEISLNPLINMHSFDSDTCHLDNISGQIATFNESPFIFIALSHGKEDSLIIKNGSYEYVSIDTAYFFASSLFYSISCDSGKILGKKLIEQNCSAFIGYTHKIELFSALENVYMDCENYAIKQFLQTDQDIYTCFEEMILFYKNAEKKLKKQGLVFASIQLGSNRRSLSFEGNKNLVQSDFKRNVLA